MWCRRIFELQKCEYRKDPISKLVEEWSKNINGNEMIYNGTLNGYN